MGTAGTLNDIARFDPLPPMRSSSAAALTGRRRFAPLLLSAAVVPLLLTGCSAGGSAGPATGASTSSTSSAKSATPAPATAAADTGDGLCAKVSVAAADAAIRSTPAITAQQADTFVNGEPECGFASDDNASVIVVATVFDAKRDPFTLSQAQVAGGDLAPVAGLGDKAGVNKNELDIATGDKVLTIETFGSTDLSRDQLIALGRLFLPKI